MAVSSLLTRPKPHRKVKKPSPFSHLHSEIQQLRQEFSEDLTESVSFPSEIRVFLTPPMDGMIYCSLELGIRVKNAYPAQPPDFFIEKTVNIPPDQLDSLMKNIENEANSRAKSSTPSLFHICGLVQEFLQRVNVGETLKRQSLQGNSVRKFSTDFSGKGEKWEIPRFGGKLIYSKAENLPSTRQLVNSQSRLLTEFSHMAKIGEGGGGSVFKAFDRLEEKYYAIKCIRLSHRSQAKIDRLMREVALLSELYHPHIVRYYYSWMEQNALTDSESEEMDEEQDDSESRSSSSFSSSRSEISQNLLFESSSSDKSDPKSSNSDDFPVQTKREERRLYIKMEYCEGATLRDVLDSESALETCEKWRLFREILEALSYIHGKSLIHRDLKPANVFLNSAKSVKIGDFGLATTRRRPHSNPETDDECSSPNSKGVGTLYYMSNEQEHGHILTEKTDLYSLGVIFFEMWREYKSTMQREKEFRQLRLEMRLPEDFLASAPGNVIEILRKLLSNDPKNRPKAREMLFSELLPHRFESQLVSEVIKTVLQPKSSERKWVLDALFRQKNSEEETELRFGGQEGQGGRRLVKLRSLVQNSVISRFQTVFESFGAINISSPLVSPYYDHVKIALDHSPTPLRPSCLLRPSTVTYIETTGVLISLPNTSLLPWTRLISRKNLGGVIKRYSFSPIFTPRDSQEPHQTLEATFDICCEEKITSKSVIEAEVIKATFEALQCLSSELPSYDIYLNSSKVVDLLLIWLEIPRNLRLNVVQILSEMQRKKWPVVKSKLEKIGLTTEKADKIGGIMRQKGDIRMIQDHLRLKMGKKDYSLLNNDMQGLEQVISACVVLKVPQERVKVDLSLLYPGLLCHSGLVFQAITREKGEVLAVGGRYDNLIDHFEYPDKAHNMFDTRPVRMTGVGVCLSITPLIDRVLSLYTQSHTSPICLLGPSVCVISTGTDEARLIRERAAYCASLWKSGISALYFYTEVSLDTAVEYCHRYRVRFLVNIRLQTDISLANYTDFLTKKHHERTLSRIDLVRSLLHELKQT